MSLLCYIHTSSHLIPQVQVKKLYFLTIYKCYLYVRLHVQLSIGIQEKAQALGTSNLKYFYLDSVTMSVWCFSIARRGFNSRSWVQFLSNLKSFSPVPLVILPPTKPKINVHCKFYLHHELQKNAHGLSNCIRDRLCVHELTRTLEIYTVSVNLDAYARTHN